MSALPPAKIAVGVVVERRKAQSPWIDFTWQPVTALPGMPDALPWTLLAQDGDSTTFYAGAAEIELYRVLLAPGEDPVTITFNNGGIVTAAPGPAAAELTDGAADRSQATAVGRRLGRGR